jgi:hypothetical protein
MFERVAIVGALLGVVLNYVYTITKDVLDVNLFFSKIGKK